MAQPFTLIDEGRALSVDAEVADGRICLSASTVEEQLGWALKPEGLCKGDVCVPVRARDSLVTEGGLDLEALAGALARPLALEAGEGVAVLGTPAADRAASLATLEAPDFDLPDLAGRTHRLSDHRGKKVLLIAYASW